jgi:hypothetical protein
MGILVDAAEKLPDDVAELEKSMNYEMPAMLSSTSGKPPDLRGINWDGIVKNYHPIVESEEGKDSSEITGSVFLESSGLRLQNWLIEAQAYNKKVAASSSILGRLFSGEGEQVTAGVIHNARRFTRAKTKNGRWVEVGVSVRLAVATCAQDLKVGITLPNLAAHAQLENAKSKIGISVLGYTGQLGSLLPAPKRLDVETAIEYVTAFQKIQEKVFNDNGALIVPTVLQYDDEESSS